jgi:hypothetical protein
LTAFRRPEVNQTIQEASFGSFQFNGGIGTSLTIVRRAGRGRKGIHTRDGGNGSSQILKEKIIEQDGSNNGISPFLDRVLYRSWKHHREMASYIAAS